MRAIHSRTNPVEGRGRRRRYQESLLLTTAYRVAIISEREPDIDLRGPRIHDDERDCRIRMGVELRKGS